MATTNLPAEGRIGIEPPPEAPREPSQPLTADYFTEAQTRARANERTLAPLKYSAGAAQAEAGSDAVPGVVQEPKAVQAAPGYVIPTPKSEFPAESNSDSPARGMPGTAPVPAARSKAPIQILGGFGEAEAEYFPLNGQEAKTLATQLLDEMYAYLQNDLRFHIAVTYPRLTMRLQLIVQGEAEDQNMVIDRMLPPHEGTPLELAQQYADSVVFVIAKQRREFDEKGNVETPADAMRDELGLQKPRKRQIKNGTGSTIVDTVW